MKVKRIIELETGHPEIGDRIIFTLKTGEDIEAMAVKELTNGMVFCAVNYLNKPYPMNRQGGTRGGYKASDLRKKLNSEILYSFPDDIRERLIPVYNGDILTIPSWSEMFGERISTNEYGGVMQWEPMIDRRNRIGLLSGDIGWGWLRDIVTTMSFAACTAHGNGNACQAIEPNGVRLVFTLHF